MATLIVADNTATSDGRKSGSGNSLRNWLAGQWAVLFSNPEHFAPHPSTPTGFITMLADDFVAAQVKPLTLSRSGEVTASWLDYAGTDSAVIRLEVSRNEPIVDLAERTLASIVTQLHSPFAIIVDALGRCRSTITYKYATGRSRTINEVLSMVQVLRGGALVHHENYGCVA